MELTHQELENRRTRFCESMTAAFPEWETALIISKVNQYYFTGTMQDGLLIIKRDGYVGYFVRKSCERAKLESPSANIYPMNSYKDIAQITDTKLGSTYLESDVVTLTIFERLKKSFQMSSINSLDSVIKYVRAVKSPYEIYWLTQSGRQHDELLNNDIPALFKEGISEAELFGEIVACMHRRGYQGLTRFSMFQTEMSVGQIGFGENSLFPTSFNGPGGSKGYGAAAPVGGDPHRRLKKGDLVFIDIGIGINGYHTDKTQVYMFGGKPSELALRVHQACIDVERRAAEKLKPGAVPSKIYEDCLDNIDAVLLPDFMGYENNCVRFLGHGVGLYCDEFPVIAAGFDNPLEENMVIALEPKKGLKDIGMLGVEDTYIVTPNGGKCITGGGRDIIIV
jgi:Xaa-Pro aminopeptidase